MSDRSDELYLRASVFRFPEPDWSPPSRRLQRRNCHGTLMGWWGESQDYALVLWNGNKTESRVSIAELMVARLSVGTLNTYLGG